MTISTNTNKVSKWDGVWREYRQRCPHCHRVQLFRV